MCPNVWEKENKNQNRYIDPFKNLLMSYLNKKLSNAATEPYIGSQIFNNLLNMIPENQRPENFITAADIKGAIEQTKRNGLWSNTSIIVQGKQQYTSPRYCEVFFNDGRIGYIIDKDIHKNIYWALIIDKDYVLRQYQLDRTKPIAVGYCLMKYKTP